METTVREVFALKKLFVSRNSEGYNLDIDTNFELGNELLFQVEKYLINPLTPRLDLGIILCEKFKDKYEIIDGEQRLTLVIIFVAVLFSRLKRCRDLDVCNLEIYEDILVRHSVYKFQTISEDNLLLQNYIANESENLIKPKTDTSKRIKKTFDFFEDRLLNKSQEELKLIVEYISGTIINFNISKPIQFRYTRIKTNILLDLLENKEIANTLAYMVVFKEYKNLKTVAHDFYIEISNDEITIAVILFVGFEREEYEEIRENNNLHLVSFSSVVLQMFELEKFPIKIIDPGVLAQSVISRSNKKDLSDLKILMQFNG